MQQKSCFPPPHNRAKVFLIQKNENTHATKKVRFFAFNTLSHNNVTKVIRAILWFFRETQKKKEPLLHQQVCVCVCDVCGRPPHNNMDLY